MNLKKHIPNTITCCNLLSGCVATMYALEGMYPLAFTFIIAGAVFDFFDGLTARALKVSSPIGKELDSLADVITFGLAPSTIVFAELSVIDYPAFLEPLRPWLPFAAFIMAAFSALRLAKFNLDERQTTSFIGLPTPANALFWASLIVGSRELIEGSPYMVFALMMLLAVSCWLLVSEVPMFALKFKHWGWAGNQTRYIFIATSALLIAIFGITGIAIVILWYVVLSLYTNMKG